MKPIEKITDSKKKTAEIEAVKYKEVSDCHDQCRVIGCSCGMWSYHIYGGMDEGAVMHW